MNSTSDAPVKIEGADSSLQSHSQLSLKGHSDWMRFLRTGRKQKSFYFHEEQEGGTGELQASQTHQSPWVGDRANNTRKHF